MPPLSLMGLRIHRSVDGGSDVKSEPISQPIQSLVAGV